MIDTLRSDTLRVSIDRRRAELNSIVDRAGVEYLWQGDRDVWSGRSPVLFPVVGRLAGDRYSHAGRGYALPQHGFARRMEFTPVEVGGSQATYALRPDEATWAAYPFEFELLLSYRLEGSALDVGYHVANRGGTTLPFSLGGHPGFSCAWHPGDALEEYFLEFEQDETADTHLVKDGLIDLAGTRRVLEGQRVIPLTKTLFDHNALVFAHLRSSSVTLRSHWHPNAVRVDFPRFPFLGIWAKPGAPYVCIEPWFGHADPVGRPPGSPIETKPGIVLLPPGQSFECGWRATVTTGG